MSPFEEGFRNAIAGGRRSDNPYARGWSRVAALVMPGGICAEWDDGHQQGLKYRSEIGRIIEDTDGS